MKTITITEAKRKLGEYLKKAAAGEDIGIVAGADIISLRKVEVIPADRVNTGALGKKPQSIAWPDFPAFDGGPADGAINHDKYLYDKPSRKKSLRAKSHK